MSIKKDDGQWKQIFYSRWFLAVLILLSLFLSVSYLRAFYQEYKIKQQIKELQSDLDVLKTKKIETMEVLKYVNSADFAEEKARTAMNMMKPGENVAFIPDSESSGYGGQTGSDLVKLPHNKNFIKWFKLFFDKSN